MLHSQHIGVLILLCFILISSVFGAPSWFHWGPSANRGPLGGPSWNGGPDQSTDNIILHSNGGKGNWRY